ncbi:unnamed protein product [Danaus chrysippus]|uniref:(African queen) hypothetical protein n=1 Tax=Danaus chrysippus TaxID=151541 RepID=A0A8J2QE46_9NEOP|nr:unnamed protein product [Danaus chrysippus]
MKPFLIWRLAIQIDDIKVMWLVCVLCLCVTVSGLNLSETKKSAKERENLLLILTRSRVEEKILPEERKPFMDSTLGVHSEFLSYLLPEEYFYDKLQLPTPPPPPENKFSNHTKLV